MPCAKYLTAMKEVARLKAENQDLRTLLDELEAELDEERYDNGCLVDELMDRYIEIGELTQQIEAAQSVNP